MVSHYHISYINRLLNYDKRITDAQILEKARQHFSKQNIELAEDELQRLLQQHIEIAKIRNLYKLVSITEVENASI